MAVISAPFESRELLLTAQIAETWHIRPSELLAVAEPVEALQIDAACAILLWEWREKQQKRFDR